MDGQNERLGTLMAFSDIGLILSTYGVLLAFNFIVEPISVNTWIVCTFFVGIKILVVGIADITGIGKSAIISVIFIIIADAVILFVNQLMAFGLSMRMLLIMTLVDIVVLAAAVLIWKRYAARELPPVENEDDWVYAGESSAAALGERQNVPIDQNGLNELFSDQKVEIDSSQPPIDIDEESIIDESFFTESSSDEEQEENFSFSEIGESAKENVETAPEETVEEIVEEPEIPLSFEEITEEIPVEEIEEQIKEPVIITPEVTESEEVKTVEEPEVIEAETQIELPPSLEEERVEISPETTPVEETAAEAEPTIEVEPAAEVESVAEEVEIVEEPEITEPEPFSVLDLETYKKLTNREPKLSTAFVPLSASVSQIEIDQYRTEARQQILLLDDQLNSLISAFNRAPTTQVSDRIEINDRVSVNHTLKESDQIIREKLKSMIDREFVSENILRQLIEMTNTINNRAYSLDVAETNLNQQKEREAERRKQQRIAEEKKLKEAKEKHRRAQEKARRREQLERERELQERKLEQEKKKQHSEKKKIKTVPVLENNEVHLQNDDLDIIIDAADLELLREFLKQQDGNKS